jgi:hypothetical protein
MASLMPDQLKENPGTLLGLKQLSEEHVGGRASRIFTLTTVAILGRLGITGRTTTSELFSNSGAGKPCRW